MAGKIKLEGFNNLSKTLSMNFYYMTEAEGKEAEQFVKMMNDRFCGDRLAEQMHRVADIVGAKVLNTSLQDYEPHGASTTVLIAESSPKQGAFHLDKSHLTVHTYPDICAVKRIASFRTDIEVSTCGDLRPIQVLNYLLCELNPDLAWIDYRIRGFTRDRNGMLCFADDRYERLEQSLDSRLMEQYRKAYTVLPEMYQVNLRLCKKKQTGEGLRNEMEQIFSGHPAVERIDE